MQQLARLLADFDKAPTAALELEIDRLARQRYATVSRLAWLTDLEAAKAAARATGRPILSLRMLGRLDEDLSCANSRLFRATLYADAAVSALLRDGYVLHWSSVRPVPRVTIDFGDGRRIVRTTTGNSAHYVLDADGRVLDALPGLYAPVAFHRELAQSLALAKQVRGTTPRERDAIVRAYHQRLARQATPPPQPPTIRAAQRATMSKAMIEVPDLRAAGLAPPAALRDDAAEQAALARLLYPAKTPVFDARARALIARLHGASDPAMLARLEEHVLADTAINQTQLRPQIARQLAHHGAMDFAELDAFVYAVVFHTPAADPWLGLVPRTDFSGLPGDGVVLPR